MLLITIIFTVHAKCIQIQYMSNILERGKLYVQGQSKSNALKLISQEDIIGFVIQLLENHILVCHWQRFVLNSRPTCSKSLHAVRGKQQAVIEFMVLAGEPPKKIPKG